MRVAAILLCACSSASSAPTPEAESHAPEPPVVSTRAAPIPPRLGDASVTARVIAAKIVAAVGDDIATDRPTYARADQKVTLYAVLEVEVGSTRVYHSDAPALRLGGKAIAVRPIAQAPAIELRVRGGR